MAKTKTTPTPANDVNGVDLDTGKGTTAPVTSVNPYGTTGDTTAKPATPNELFARLYDLTTKTAPDGTKGFRLVRITDLETACNRTGDGKAIRNIVRSVLGPNAPVDANGNKLWVFKLNDPAFVTIVGKLVAKGVKTGSRVTLDENGFYTL